MTLRLVVVVALALALVTSCDELVPGTTPGPAPETTDPPAPLVALRDLTVAPEHRCTPYDRDNDYPYPQSIEAQIAARLGGMWSPYDGTRFDSLRESDIEHIVAVSEAHDSGLCAASTAVRRRFARDLDNLTLATPQLNRYEKGARDAAEWLPEHNRCWFAATIVAVRQEYKLTIDRREADALGRILAGCDSFELVTPEPST